MSRLSPAQLGLLGAAGVLSIGATAWLAGDVQGGGTIPPGGDRWVMPWGAPRGKGISIRSVKHGGSPAELAQRCAWLGLRWVKILTVWEKSDGRSIHYHHEELPAYADALREAGIDVWVWGWPRPEPEARERFAHWLAKTEQTSGARGVMINAEKPFYGRKHEAAARALMNMVRARVSGPIGFSSYGGGPKSHPSFPWQAFASVSNFGLPQIYDTKHTLEAGYPTRAVNQWRAAGFEHWLPIWGASSAHTPAQMADIASRTPTDGACCWWDLYHVLQSKKRAQFVRDFRLPSTSDAVAGVGGSLYSLGCSAA